MKIRQVYSCNEKTICIQLSYDSDKYIKKMKKIPHVSPMELGEYAMPKVEVTEEFFETLVNHPDLYE